VAGLGQIAMDKQQLLIASAIALAVIAVAAAAIGWLIAGWVLRPLSTITAAARRISASSLHERLALHGPDDELKELADTLDNLFARLEASFDAQRRFAANASHELRTLFQPFQRFGPRPARRDGGHGLGLSIVRAIATAHAATITAQPRPGGGLAIDATFPRQPVPAPLLASSPGPAETVQLRRTS
jgi:signal transduction histidine kinase